MGGGGPRDGDGGHDAKVVEATGFGAAVRSFKEWLSQKMVATNFGFALELIQTILAVLAVVLYVTRTELQLEGPDMPAWLIVLEAIMSVAFLLDYLLYFFLASSKAEYLFQMDSIVDLLSILPVLVLFSNDLRAINFLRLLRGFRIMRILKTYRSSRTVSSSDDQEVRRQIIILVSTIIIILFIASGAVHSLEILQPGSFIRPNTLDCAFEAYGNYETPEYLWPAECRLHYFDSFYFVLVTTATIGYGDIVPSTAAARILILVLIASLFTLVPPEFSRLSSLMAKSSHYSKPYFGDGHVLVTGDVFVGAAHQFLKEFYHDDRGHQQTKVVFLLPAEPDDKWLSVLAKATYQKQVQYVRGDPLNPEDLYRARAQSASAAFIFTDGTVHDLWASDAKSVLIAKALRTSNPLITSYCQLSRKSSEKFAAWAEWDVAMSTHEIRMGLLAVATALPGFTTLIANLISSSSTNDAWMMNIEEDIANEEQTQLDLLLAKEKAATDDSAGIAIGRKSSKKKKKASSTESVGVAKNAWLREYMGGVEMELYTVKLSEYFSTVRFDEAAAEVYECYGVIMLGVETYVRKSRLPKEFRLAARQAATGSDSKEGSSRMLFPRKEESSRGDTKGRKKGEQEPPDRNLRSRWIFLMNPQGYFISSDDYGVVIAANQEEADRLKHHGTSASRENRNSRFKPLDVAPQVTKQRPAYSSRIPQASGGNNGSPNKAEPSPPAGGRESPMNTSTRLVAVPLPTSTPHTHAGITPVSDAGRPASIHLEHGPTTIHHASIDPRGTLPSRRLSFSPRANPSGAEDEHDMLTAFKLGLPAIPGSNSEMHDSAESNAEAPVAAKPSSDVATRNLRLPPPSPPPPTSSTPLRHTPQARGHVRSRSISPHRAAGGRSNSPYRASPLAFRAKYPPPLSFTGRPVGPTNTLLPDRTRTRDSGPQLRISVPPRQPEIGGPAAAGNTSVLASAEVQQWIRRWWEWDRSTLLRWIGSFRGHILLVGPLAGLGTYVKLYRQISSRPVVILTSDKLESVAEEEWEDICGCPDAYVVFGNPYSLRMLKRVGLLYALVVVSVPPPDVEQASRACKGSMSSLISSGPDSRALFLACALSTLAVMASAAKSRKATKEEAGQSSSSTRQLRVEGRDTATAKAAPIRASGLFHRRDSWDVEGPALGDSPPSLTSNTTGSRPGPTPDATQPQTPPRLLLELVSWSSLRFLSSDDTNDASLAYLLRETGLLESKDKSERRTSPQTLDVESIGLDERSRMRPEFASGEVFFGATLDTLIVQLYYNPVVLNMLHHLLYGGSRAPQKRPRHYRYKENGTIQAMLIPPAYVNRHFGELFSVLLKKHSVLAIGVYRSPKSLKAPKPYVVTNPPATLILHEEDRLFVLGPKLTGKGAQPQPSTGNSNAPRATVSARTLRTSRGAKATMSPPAPRNASTHVQSPFTSVGGPSARMTRNPIANAVAGRSVGEYKRVQPAIQSPPGPTHRNGAGEPKSGADSRVAGAVALDLSGFRVGRIQPMSRGPRMAQHSVSSSDRAAVEQQNAAFNVQTVRLNTVRLWKKERLD